MLTPEGATTVWDCVTSTLQLLTLAVLGPNGEESTTEAQARVEEGTLILTGTFDGQFANFEWVAREVRTLDGTVIDRAEEDGGRKSPGAVWDLEVQLELQAGENS